MLYVFHGSDTRRSREKVKKLTEALLKKEKDAGYFRIDPENLTDDLLLEYALGTGLFSKRFVVVLDGILENDGGEELFLERLSDVAESENIFVLVEGKISKLLLAKLGKHAVKISEYNLQPTTYNLQPAFNIFSLTDALGNRDKKKLWVLYQKALQGGAVPEEIHGVLFWQIKVMFLILKKSTSGLKPFVVGKAKRFLQNYTPREIEKLSEDMVTLYHEARQGGPELSLGLEQMILNL